MDPLPALKNMLLYDLVITTPRLVLRLPTLPELDELAELSRHGVYIGDRTPSTTTGPTPHPTRSPGA